MSEDIQSDPTTDEVGSVSEEAAAQDPPMNRAERRAMAAGKKGAASNPNLKHQSLMRGAGAGHTAATPAGQARIQTRGASRGK